MSILCRHSVVQAHGYLCVVFLEVTLLRVFGISLNPAELALTEVTPVYSLTSCHGSYCFSRQ